MINSLVSYFNFKDYYSNFTLKKSLNFWFISDAEDQQRSSKSIINLQPISISVYYVHSFLVFFLVLSFFCLTILYWSEIWKYEFEHMYVLFKRELPFVWVNSFACGVRSESFTNHFCASIILNWKQNKHRKKKLGWINKQDLFQKKWKTKSGEFRIVFPHPNSLTCGIHSPNFKL